MSPLDGVDLDLPGIEENFPTLSREQALGIAKLKEIKSFISYIVDGTPKSAKIIIFAHHKKVIASIQQHLEFIKPPVGYILIQGGILPEERFVAVRKFQEDPAVRLALVSITAGNTGFDLTRATHLVFAELPQSHSDLRQVNIFLLS